MNYTTIYNIDEFGNIIEHEDIPNINRVSILIWDIMFEFYNDYFIDDIIRPEWIPKDYKMSFSDMQLSGHIKPFWDLLNNDGVLFNHRVVFGFTREFCIVSKDNLPKLITALEDFIYTMTNEPFDSYFNHHDFSGLILLNTILGELNTIHDDCYGVAMSMSINTPHWNLYSENGDYLPYNINKNTKHWELFEKL